MNPESSVLKAIQHPDRLFIGGEWLASQGGGRLDVVSPASETVVGSFVEASVRDVDRAVNAAREAFDSGLWASLAPAERARHVRAFGAAVLARQTDLARGWTLEMGAPIAISSFMMQSADFVFNYYADLASTYPFIEARDREEGVGVVLKEPVGVVAAVVPWNGPYILAVMKIVPALIAGCTVILKPAPETPVDAYILAECAQQAGLPPGVFNVVAAGREVGDHLIRHPGVDKVAFTGSTAAGKHIGSVCAQRVARASLELGGKSAAIVLDDIDVETVAANLIPAFTMLSGQVCGALSRVLVSRKRHDALVEAIAAGCRTVKVGDPFDPQTQMGPLAMQRQYDRVLNYIDQGRRAGATLAAGGRRVAGLERGYYLEPTVFANASNDMSIAREEIFGPVTTVIPYDTLDDAIRIANDSDFGLNGAVFTNDTDAAFRVARQVRTGNLTQNGWILDHRFPFGGYKQSGVGREGGPEGLTLYTETKTVYLPRRPAGI
jgi:acyl-CoA reductase-like NAD-dependent aldehyde dehydrogenase